MEIDFSPIEELEFGLSGTASPDVDFGTGDVQGAIDLVKVNGQPLPIVNRTVDVPVPTKTSQLTNDSNFITLSDIPPFPTVPTKTSQLQNDGSDGTSTYVEADELGAVATSNNYNDLNNKPTIPAPITVDSEIDDTSTNPVQNQALYNAVVGTEVSKMAYTSGWVEPYAPDGYNTYIILTLPSGTFTDDSLIELVNYANFQSFAKHGFVIFGVETSTQRVWISSMGVPENNISFNFRIYNYGS